MSDELARIAHEIAKAGANGAERAHNRLREAAKHGEPLDLTDHDLVVAISAAVWNRELITAQYGLSEMEIRTAADAERMVERRAA